MSHSAKSISVVTLRGRPRVTSNTSGAIPWSPSLLCAASLVSKPSEATLGANMGRNLGITYLKARIVLLSRSRTTHSARRSYMSPSCEIPADPLRRSRCPWNSSRAFSGLCMVWAKRGSNGRRKRRIRPMVLNLTVPPPAFSRGSFASWVMIFAELGSTNGRSVWYARAPIGLRTTPSSCTQSRSPATFINSIFSWLSFTPNSLAPPASTNRILSCPSGVIGWSKPCTAPNENHTFNGSNDTSGTG